MKALSVVTEALAEASPLTLAALGVTALFGGPVIKAGLRGVGVAAVKGALEISDQLAGTVNQTRKQWDGIVTEARAYQMPYNMENVAGTTVGAGIGGAIGAGLGSMVGPGVGTAAGGGIGGAVGAMVGDEMKDRMGDQPKNIMKMGSEDNEHIISEAKPGPKSRNTSKDNSEPVK